MSAHHNSVHLYAGVCKDPTIKTNAEGQYEKAIFYVHTIRSSRPYKDQNEKHEIEFDQVLIITKTPEIIAKLDTIHKNDIVLIKGTVTTRNQVKTTTCNNCGETFSVNESTDSEFNTSMITSVTPIDIEVIKRDLTNEEMREELISHKEISNEVMLIGNLCDDPQFFKTKHQKLTSYQLGITRKLYLKEDSPEVNADYPYIRVYGEQADLDYKLLRKASMVMIDGFLKVRPFTRHTECPCCGEKKDVNDANLEVVPYTTEYLQNYTTMEEYNAAKEDEYKESMRNAGFYE